MFANGDAGTHEHKIHSQTIVYLLKVLAAYSLVFLLGNLPQLFVQLFGFIRELQHQSSQISKKNAANIVCSLKNSAFNTWACLSLTRDPASSIKSMALSGRNRSLKEIKSNIISI
jgi:hypothetical protein